MLRDWNKGVILSVSPARYSKNHSVSASQLASVLFNFMCSISTPSYLNPFSIHFQEWLRDADNFIAKNDDRGANKYLADFSRLMRTVIKNSDQDFVSFASEIETLGIYLELEHFRFGDKFDYDMQISPEVDPDSVKIPPMLIQPYIENAI